MPHTRNRWLASVLESELRWSPAVAIYGMRQVGKTTLVEQITSHLKGTFVTLDNDSQLESSRLSPQDFCDRKKLLCIDECQKGPWLFPVIKSRIGTQRKPGKFLLTGSVRFTAKKEINESLTGRILTHELLPFAWAELKGLPISNFLRRVFECAAQDSMSTRTIDRLISHDRSSITEIKRHYAHGGIPIPAFTRDEQKRSVWFRSYLDAVIMRDVPMVEPRLAMLSLRQGLSFLRALALEQGTESSATFLADHAGIRPLQATLLLRTLEVLCIIDRIPPMVMTQKSTRKLRTEWKDISLRNHALGLPENTEPGETELRLLMSQEFRSQLAFMTPTPTWSFFRSREGSQIPWIFRQGRSVVAIHYADKEKPEPYDTRTLRAFLDSQKHAIGVFLGSRNATPLTLGKRLVVLPFQAIF